MKEKDRFWKVVLGDRQPKLQEQSALDAYRDSVLAAERERTLEDAALILDNGHFLTRDSPERKWAIQVAAKIRALKGSSDAAIDEAKWQGESQAHSEERAFRKALNSPAQVSYPCGCTASEGSPRHCPEHGKRRERSGD